MKRTLIAALLLAGLGLLAPAGAGADRHGPRQGPGRAGPAASPTPRCVIEFQGGVTRKFEVKTNKKGEYMQVGMQPGPYRFTASKEGYQPSASSRRGSPRRSHAGPRLQARTPRPRPQAAGGGARGRGAARQLPEGRRAAQRRQARRGRGGLQGDPREEPRRRRGLPEPRPDLPGQEGLSGRRDGVPEGARAAARLDRHRRRCSRASTRSRARATRRWRSREVGGRQPGGREGPVQPRHLPAEREQERGGDRRLRGRDQGRPEQGRGVLPPRRAHDRPGQDPRRDREPREVPEPEPDRRAERGDGAGAAEGSQEVIAERVAAVRERIARAAERARRSPADVRARRRQQDAAGRGGARGLRRGRARLRREPRPGGRAQDRRDAPTSSRGRALAPRRAPAVEQGAPRRGALRARPVDRLARARGAARTRRARRPAATVRGLIQVDLAGEATEVRPAGGRAAARARRRCAGAPACGSRA